MRLILACFFALVVSAQSRATPQPTNNFGLGMMVGSMTSVTGKYWFSPREAIDFGIGVSGTPWTAFYGDYLWHIPGLFGRGTQFGRESVAYVGGGGGLLFWNHANDCGRWSCSWDNSRHDSSGAGVFMRGFFGFEWGPLHRKFGVFGEVGPSFIVVPTVGGFVDIEVGGRYYF